MSNFLSNVIARAEGHSQGLRPRLASVFEKPSDASVGAVEITAAEHSRVTPPREAAPPQPQTRGSLTPLQIFAREQQIVPEPSAVKEAPAAKPEALTAWREASALPRPHFVSRVESPRQVIGAPGAVTTPDLPAKPAVERSEPVVERPVRSGGVARSVASEIDPASRQAVTGGTVRMTGTPSPVTASSKFSVPAIAVRPRVTEALTKGVKGEPSEPVIHVSIGRIEVRATTPQTPRPKSERRAVPVMGLDEYLSGRRAGPK